MKRFYKNVSLQENADGYVILLDGKQVKTKLGRLLLAPNREIANRIVAEWERQEKIIVPDDMPVTQILNTKIDRVQNEHDEISKVVANYLNTDLLCYLAASPAIVVNEQSRIWGRWRKWFEERSGSALNTSTGIHSLEHDKKAHNYLKFCIDDMNIDRFTILQLVTSLSGSVVLALAFCNGEASSEDILESIFIEENYKETLYDAELHGSDPMVCKKKLSILRDLKAAEFYIKSFF